MLCALQNADWHGLFAKKTVHRQVNMLNDITQNVSKILFLTNLLRVMAETHPG